MLPAERRARIVDSLVGTEFLATEDLATRFSVSTETIRRDVDSLAQAGLLRRVYGGIARQDAEPRVADEPAFDVRNDSGRDAKQAIGRAAAGLVGDGDVVAIDVGTTALAVARALAPRFHGTVATPSLRVAGELAGRSEVEVLLTGGRVRGEDLVCFGSPVEQFFTDVRCDIAFVSSGGVSIAAGLTDFYREEVAARRRMIAGSRRAYLISDSSKFGQIAPFRVCGLEQLTGLITDAAPSVGDDALPAGLQLVLAAG